MICRCTSKGDKSNFLFPAVSDEQILVTLSRDYLILCDAKFHKSLIFLQDCEMSVTIIEPWITCRNITFSETELFTFQFSQAIKTIIFSVKFLLPSFTASFVVEGDQVILNVTLLIYKELILNTETIKSQVGLFFIDTTQVSVQFIQGLGKVRITESHKIGIE